MINDLLQSISKVYIAYGTTDFRKQIDSLCIEVKSKFHLNPYEKAAFIFCNKKRNSIKVLCYDKNLLRSVIEVLINDTKVIE